MEALNALAAIVARLQVPVQLHVLDAQLTPRQFQDLQSSNNAAAMMVILRKWRKKVLFALSALKLMDWPARENGQTSQVVITGNLERQILSNAFLQVHVKKAPISMELNVIHFTVEIIVVFVQKTWRIAVATFVSHAHPRLLSHFLALCWSSYLYSFVTDSPRVLLLSNSGLYSCRFNWLLHLTLSMQDGLASWPISWRSSLSR
jgi:hypothetical protein